MIDLLPVPIELQKFAVEGYAKHGRGFIRCISSGSEWEIPHYHSEQDCHLFYFNPNGENLQRLVQIYNPVVEFVLFVGFKPQDKQYAATNTTTTHLYPRLIPLMKVK
jgi:hypothetical protein